MYTQLDKLIFAIVTLARKHHPYFQAHIVVILTDQLLKIALYQLNTSGKVAKWALELFEFNLVF